MSPVIGFYLLVAMGDVVIWGWFKAVNRSVTTQPRTFKRGYAVLVAATPFAIQRLVPGQQNALGLFLWYLAAIFAAGFCLGLIKALRGIR